MTQAQLQERTTVLIIRDSDPLCVETNLLTEESPVFRFILDECKFEEHDLTDFSPEAVGVFLTLLRDKELTDVDKSLFREINKLAVTFEIAWLEKDCQRWMENKILAVSREEDKTFLFDESYYAFKTLKKDEFMTMFIDEFGNSDDITFISRYLENFDNLELSMLCPLLQLAGSNYKVILNTLTNSVATNVGLTKNTMFILQNINVSWQVGWSSLFNVILELPDTALSVSDLKIIGNLQNSHVVAMTSKKKEIPQTLIYNSLKSSGRLMALSDIVTSMSTGQTTSMMEVFRKMLYILSWNQYTPSKEDMDQFILELERLCQEKHIQRVPWRVIDLMLPVLRVSTKDNAESFISLLTSIRQSKVMSSSNRENIVIKQISEIKVNFDERKLVYKFKHPSTGSCTLPGECGFMERLYAYHGYNTLELVTDDKYYVGTGVHYHNDISARGMCMYRAITLTLPDGSKLDTLESGGLGRWWILLPMPILRRWRFWWEDWLPDGTTFELKDDYYVVYNVSDYMVAK